MNYREFTCVVCGEKAIDMSRTRSKMVCSERCAYLRHRKIHGLGKGIVTPSCIHNDEIRCLQRKCGSCGWNPEVERKRKAALTCG